MNKERVVLQGVTWIKENLSKKALEDISEDTIRRKVKHLAWSVERFKNEQTTEIGGRNLYRGNSYAFFLRIKNNFGAGKKYGLDFVRKSLEQGPPGSLANAETFAKYGPTTGHFGTGTGNMVLGAVFIPPNFPPTATSCTSYKKNIPFMIYELPPLVQRKKEARNNSFTDRWRFKKPFRYLYCDEEDIVRDQLDSNNSILRQKGF